MTTILITGANRGIGAAIATIAQSRGMDVIRAVRPGNRGDVAFDVTQPDAVMTAMRGIGILADLEPADVADGIVTLAENITLNDTGKFLRWNGEERSF
ncbi:hypothetical protein [Yoonia maritima]|uniref:hypothetical protein n=1 Tax=Yoonia maritima TaxID=1435347 RepID=UPI000D10EA5A|nr:hypothetical protein [Yoonia maritima]